MIVITETVNQGTSHFRMYASAGLVGTGIRFVQYYRHHHATKGVSELLHRENK